MNLKLDKMMILLEIFIENGYLAMIERYIKASKQKATQQSYSESENSFEPLHCLGHYIFRFYTSYQVCYNATATSPYLKLGKFT
jgi:hypothetical protein